MEYSENTVLNNMDDVKALIHFFVSKLGTSFHPDDDVSSYVKNGTAEPVFTPKEAKILNRLLDDSFTICDDDGEDIYGITLAEINSNGK